MVLVELSLRSMSLNKSPLICVAYVVCCSPMLTPAGSRRSFPADPESQVSHSSQLSSVLISFCKDSINNESPRFPGIIEWLLQPSETAG